MTSTIPTHKQRKLRHQLKGRPVDISAVQPVIELCGHLPNQADYLIEHLHILNDHYGALKKSTLRALAHYLTLPMAHVFEVASFYHHFSIVEDDDIIAKVVVRVCHSLPCSMANSPTLYQQLWDRWQNNDQVLIKQAPCLGLCDQAVGIHVNQQTLPYVNTVHSVNQAIEQHLNASEPLSFPGEYEDFDQYTQKGGYLTLKALLSGKLSIESVLDRIKTSGLKGMGGAGFPTADKWQIVRQYPKPRYSIMNADEGEPGTFKDRYYLENYPHRVLEGFLIASWVVEAKSGYIYLRDEYPNARAILSAEIPKLIQHQLIYPDRLHLRRGAGAYICGEESALIESIEGKRGLPRHRPPYVAQSGLFNRPTLVNNVETLYWVREILHHGSDWFIKQGKPGHPGLRSFSVSGPVKSPGVKVAPSGISFRELLEHYCGGMQQGHQLKGFLPGGASGGILDIGKIDYPLDFKTLEPLGCFIGSAAIIVLSDRCSIKDVVVNLLDFFKEESCGQCTPCRVGCEKASLLLKQEQWNTQLLTDLCQLMADSSICGLGQAAPNPIRCAIKYFNDDLITRSSS